MRTPSEMPGQPFDFGRWKGGPMTVRRPSVYFDPAIHPERLPLRLTPPPELYRAFDGDIDAIVHHMRKLTDDALGWLRAARKGRPVMGAAELRRIHPWSEPVTMREPGGERVPTFKLGARGLTARTRRIEACLETTQFGGEHEKSRLQRLAGEDAVFPYGTYLMRVQHGASVAEPHHEAKVTAPGPTLDEVKAELAERDATAPRKVPSMGAPIRDAFRDEATDIVELEAMALAEPPAATSSSTSGTSNPRPTSPTMSSGSSSPTPSSASGARPEPSARPGPHARHRFAKTSSEIERAGERGASRIITLRDRRRGRPKSSDPPG